MQAKVELMDYQQLSAWRDICEYLIDTPLAKVIMVQLSQETRIDYGKYEG